MSRHQIVNQGTSVGDVFVPWPSSTRDRDSGQGNYALTNTHKTNKTLYYNYDLDIAAPALVLIGWGIKRFVTLIFGSNFTNVVLNN